MVLVNYPKLHVSDTEGLIEAEYENTEHGNLKMADSSLLSFTVVCYLFFSSSLANFLSSILFTFLRS